MRSTRSSWRMPRASSSPSSAPIWTSWLKFLDLSSLMFMRKLGLPVASMNRIDGCREATVDGVSEPFRHAPREQPEPSWWRKREPVNDSSTSVMVKYAPCWADGKTKGQPQARQPRLDTCLLRNRLKAYS